MNIMLTGMWPPTNEMLRQFSCDRAKNPEGWKGENWKGKGFDVHAFFPEFPDYPEGGLDGQGDFRIDYRTVSADFWRIAAALKPRAIITFSAAAGRYPGWILERLARNLSEWKLFAHVAEQPSPCPPDASFPADQARESTLPIERIVEAINRAGVYADVAESDPMPARVQDDAGSFVSEFIAYHGVWYQADNCGSDAEHPCLAAGHIHVGTPAMPYGERRCPVGPQSEAYRDTLERAIRATELTLETVIDHIDKFRRSSSRPSRRPADA